MTSYGVGYAIGYTLAMGGTFAIATTIYLLPWIVAWRRGNHNSAAIFVLNLLLGWTFLGWLIALVWAMVKPAPVPEHVRVTSG